MTLKRLLLISTICLFGNINAQTTNAFRVNYDQALFDLPGNAIEALSPNNYLFAGTNMNFLPIYGTVTQVNDIGNLVWSKRYYDGSFGFQLNDIKKDVAGNEYYLCGGSESNAGVFMRLDAAGNVVASTKFSISQADGAYFNRVIKTSDGGYVAVGYVTGYDPDGAGPEIDFVQINYTDANGDPQTEVIGSPLIVKMDANGNHLWHKITRYYNNAAKDPALHRIYNDASFNDVVEVSDGYIAVGSYDVNQHNSNTNSDGDDATANDALILKTNTTGTIIYHKQYDALNFSPTQTSKYLSAINKTSAGDPIAAGSDNGREWIIKFAAAGGWASTFSRLFTYSTSFLIPDPVEVSQIYEVAGSTDLVTMGMYLKVFPLLITNSIHRINSTATTNVWAKYFTFSLATILPRGSQTSDGGYIMSSTVMGGANFDYHVIKTDPTGNTPLTGCAPVSFTPTPAAGPTTVADPYYNSWSGTVGPTALAVLVTNVTPTSSIQCSFVACTAPTISSQPTDATICSTGSGSLAVTASAGPYQWQYNNAGTWANVANGTPAGFTFANSTTNSLSITSTVAAQGTYQFRVIVGSAGCDVISNIVTVTVPGATRLAPTGAQCSGTQLNFEAFPTSGATYAWTVTPPGGTSATPTSGTGQTFSTTPTNNTVSPASFSVTVNVTFNGITCPISFTPTINPVPIAPVIGAITQPTCAIPSGSVALSGLPASGSWTVTASPGGTTTTGTGTSTTFAGLTAGTSYTFTVTNATNCTSTASTSAIVNAAPATPTAPVIGTITQPTCSVATGSVALSGLPAVGSWTVTTTPGGSTTIGSGASTTISGLTAGTTYTFTVTNAGGCTSSASTNAILNAALTTPTAPIVGTITQPSCSVATGSVDFSGLPSTGSWTITASPGATTTTGTGTTGTFAGLTAGTTYTFTVTNAGSCTSTASSNAVINTAPVTPTAPVIGTITQPTCVSPTGSVALSGLPSSGSWTVTANPGGTTITGTGTAANFTGLASGTTYTFTVTNSVTCASVSSTNAAINTVPGAPTAPTAGTVTQPTCAVPTGTIEVASPLGANYTYSINGVTFQASTTFSGLSPGNYTITVTDLTSGCSSTSASTVTINAIAGAPVATLVSSNSVTCFGSTDGELEISVSGGQAPYTYVWTPNVGTGPSLANLAAGNYSVVVTDDLGCSSIANFTVGSPNNIAVNGNPTNVLCAISDGTITTAVTGGTGPYTYSWTPNGETTDNLTGLAVGTYSTTVTDDNGCSATESFTIGTTGSLPVDIDPDYALIDAGTSIQLTATGGDSYTWTPATGLSCTTCPDPIASPTTSTVYYVTATDANGCIGGDTVLVQIKLACGELFVPNIFSPNGSGPDKNNTLCVFGTHSCVTELSFAIYSRWGEKVFETTDITICWDGTFKGKPMNSGIYVYKLNAVLTNGDIIEQSGNTTLVR